MRSGVEGIAVSPGIEGETTRCQFFSPEFFAALSEGKDINRDGITTIQETFVAAMAVYSTSLGIEKHGSIARSIPELTKENFEKIIRSKKATVVEIGATWCGPCKQFQREIQEIWGMVGEQANFMTITSDLYPESYEELVAQMGIPMPKTIPAVYVTTDDGKTFAPFKSREKETIALEL